MYHEMKNIFVILSLFVSCLSVSYAQNNNYCFVYNMNEHIPLSLATRTSVYTGWTLNYCNNIYGSCEGWSSTHPYEVYGKR